LYLVSPRSALREPERRLGAQFWRPRLNRSNRSQGEIATVESPRDCAETRVQPHWLIVCAISRLNQHGNFRGCSRLESCRRFLKQGHTCKRHAGRSATQPQSAWLITQSKGSYHVYDPSVFGTGAQRTVRLGTIDRMDSSQTIRQRVNKLAECR
jgi:hypothetical protein